MAIRMPSDRDLWVAALLLVVVVAANAAAWCVSRGWWIVLGYDFIFAIGICVIIPTWYHGILRCRPLDEIGLSLRRWRRDLTVGLGIALLTVAPRLGSVTVPHAGSLATLTAAMCLSAMSEEVFFRGFFQTRIRRAAGVVPAVILSGVAFSVYHVGYGTEWQQPDRLIQMMLVGIMFAIAFQTTGSVITSFTLNLAHAVVTFLEKGEYFDGHAAIASVAAVLVGVLWISRVSTIAARSSKPQ